MLTPGSDHVCRGCSFICDHVDAARQHFEHADLAFAAVSRVPLQRIEEVKHRMGWTFPWVSSHGSDFNFDFGVSFTPEDIAAGRAIYNYGEVIQESQDMFGVHIFVKDDGGAIFHTYSTYRRGAELLMGALNWLDLVPKRPQRERRHHELGAAARRILNRTARAAGNARRDGRSPAGQREIASEGDSPSPCGRGLGRGWRRITPSDKGTGERRAPRQRSPCACAATARSIAGGMAIAATRM